MEPRSLADGGPRGRRFGPELEMFGPGGRGERLHACGRRCLLTLLACRVFVSPRRDCIHSHQCDGGYPRHGGSPGGSIAGRPVADAQRIGLASRSTGSHRQHHS